MQLLVSNSFRTKHCCLTWHFNFLKSCWRHLLQIPRNVQTCNTSKYSCSCFRFFFSPIYYYYCYCCSWPVSDRIGDIGCRVSVAGMSCKSLPVISCSYCFLLMTRMHSWRVILVVVEWYLYTTALTLQLRQPDITFGQFKPSLKTFMFG